jgi:hypothetical protein
MTWTEGMHVLSLSETQPPVFVIRLALHRQSSPTSNSVKQVRDTTYVEKLELVIESEETSANLVTRNSS